MEASVVRRNHGKNQRAPTRACDDADARVGLFLQQGLFHQLVGDRVADELGVARDLELLHDPRLVGARGLGGEVEVPRDRLEALAAGELEEDLALAVRQQLVGGLGGAVAEREALGELRADVPSARGDLAERADQLLGLAVLRYIARRAGLEHSRGDRALGVHAVHEHRQLRMLRLDALYQLDRIGAGHANVHQHDVDRRRAQLLVHVLAVDCLGSNHDVGRHREDVAQPPPHHGVVVSDQYPDLLHSPWTGIDTDTWVPSPGTLEMFRLPCSMMTRSRMPSKPKVFFFPAASRSNPLPSSLMSRRTCEVSRRSRISTLRAPAWRAMLVSDSCRMRNRTMLRSSERSTSPFSTLTAQGIPLRFWNSSTSHSTPGRMPRSSAAGRSAVATLRTIWIRASTRFFRSCTCPATRGAFFPDSRPMTERSILRAVSACPISSWISRAMWARSPSRTDSWCAESSRSISWCSRSAFSAFFRSVISMAWNSTTLRPPVSISAAEASASR